MRKEEGIKITKLHEIIFYRYLSTIPGPTADLYNILNSSIVNREVHLIMKEHRALTKELRDAVARDIKSIRPVLNKRTITNQQRSFSRSEQGLLNLESFEQYTKNIDRLLLLSQKQVDESIHLIDDETPRYIIRLTRKSLGDEEVIKFLKVLGVEASSGRFTIIKGSNILALYLKICFGESFYDYAGQPSIKLIETIQVLSNQGGLYTNFERAVGASIRLSG